METATDNQVIKAPQWPADPKDGKGPECLNCAMPLRGENFCPNCGQKNDTRKLSAWELITEGISGLFSVDSKLFRSLKPIFTKPGQLAVSYTAGKRASYIYPSRMYLSASILYFLLMSLFSSSEVPVVRIDGQELLPDKPNNVELFFNADSASTNDYERLTYFVREKPDMTWEEVVREAKIEPTRLKEYYFTQYRKMTHLNLKSFLGFVKGKLPFILFLILPVLALLLKLFYLRKGLYYTDHLIFAFYTQTALFIGLTVGFIVDKLFDTEIENLLFLVFFIYLYYSFRRMYQQSRMISLLKLSIISFLYLYVGFIFLFIASLFLFLWY